MAMQAEHEPDNWEALADLPDEGRQRELRRLYEALVPLGEAERRAKAEGFIRREYALSEEKLLTVTRSRLLAWLDMEPGAAKTVATSYSLVMQTMPGSIAMRRVSVVQTVSLGMTTAQIDGLYKLIPAVISQIPRVARSEQTTPPMATPAPAMSGRARTEQRRGWAFWRRG